MLLEYSHFPLCEGPPLVLQVTSIKESSMGMLSSSDFPQDALGYPATSVLVPFGLGRHLPKRLFRPIEVALAL